MLFQSDTLELRALEPEDGAAVMDILNAPDVANRLFGLPMKAQGMAFADWLGLAAHRKSDFYFAVTERQTGKILGLCAYQDIDYRNGRVTVWAALADAGLTVQTLTLLAEGAFAHLRMEHIALLCLRGDTDTAASAEAAGFTLDAIFYSRIKKSGKSYDLTVYTLLKGEEGDT